MKITKESRNNLLKRKEVVFVLESEKNPGFSVVKEKVVHGFKTHDDHVAIKSIKNNFGTHQFVIEAFVYDTKEDKERIEPRVKPKKAAPGA